MSLNMKTLTQALAKTAAVIEKTVQTTVQDVTGPKALQEYDLVDQIGSAGPGLAWRLFSAKAARDSSKPHQYSTVCVWVLDKKALSEARARAGLSKATEDAFLDVIRGDAARLVRLRHPGVVHVVQALDESKNSMAMVTEPLFASLSNALGNMENVGKVPKELKGLEMSLLEVKHGLLQLSESLEFLHSNANLIHRAIAPENILITSNGAWKIGGFGFAISKDQASAELSSSQAFHYAEYDIEDSVLPLQPSLNYTAPELVRSRAPSFGSASDIFSFGCVAYHLIVKKPLFDCKNNVKMYMNTLTYISSNAFSSIPHELVSDLQKMLSSNESFRPTALEFTGSPFFRNDTKLRALRFLDHMLGRDNMQKSEFLKALADMWKEFDSRVLRYKVLPPLCAELRNSVMQPMILPMVLTIAESQDKNDFEISTLPALIPVLSSASGETLLLFVKQLELIINKSCHENLIAHVLPLVIRSYDDTDPRIQGEALRRSIPLARQLDIQTVKQSILPHVHSLALRTTVAAIRVNALLLLGELVSALDKHATMEILQTIQRCTAVDRSAPTLMCSLGVANAILKQYDVEFVAEHVLPIIVPLVIVQQLNVQQFAKYMVFIKDILRKIEEKKGVMVNDSSSAPEIGPAGFQPKTLFKSVESMASVPGGSKPSWDEDWIPNSKDSKLGIKPVVSSFGNQSIGSMVSAHPRKDEASNSSSAADSLELRKGAPVPSIDIEWPSPAPSSKIPGLHTVHRQQGSGPSSSTFDDLDPFANWPPRQGATTSTAANTNSVNTMPHAITNGFLSATTSLNRIGNYLSNGHNGWALDLEGSSDSSNSQGTWSLNTNTDFQKNLPLRAVDMVSPLSHAVKEQAAPKLAPPPSTTVGIRGRGRGKSSSSRPRASSDEQSSQQPPLLDLL